MITKISVVGEVKKLIHDYFADYEKSGAEDSRYKVPLISRLYNEEEIAEVVESLLSPDRLTLNSGGDLKIEKFEKDFTSYIGMKNGIMMNSGSSANLVAFFVLTNPTIKNPLKPGDEVIVPALNWSTSITPLYAFGLKPVFVDVNLSNYGMNIEQVKAAITSKTKAILVVHLLGFPVDMESIMTIARENNLYVIEDTCESPGSEWNGRKSGSSGDISTHSFYLSHHITTVEGGMLMTNNDEYAELARIIRSQGVMRNVKSAEYKDTINAKYPNIDPRFLFTNVGYNFRPSEMEGAFGIVQMKKFEDYLQKRIANASFWQTCLSRYANYLILPKVDGPIKSSWFFYPILLKDGVNFTVKDLTAFLEKNGVETRPVMSGDYTEHPLHALFENRVVGNLENTRLINKNGFIIGVHAGICDKEREHVKACFEDFFRNR